MIKQQFYVFMLGTVFYAWFFADAILSGHLFLTGFWGVLLIRKLMLAYKADRWLRKIEKG
ncbi:DUF3272 family protein [Lactococcus insecticola]|uniref:DUF3272 domain-containing protein n=1 Tax=Pseudolactococcus insecticola TaxID=2709158 RepID=A0A6A0B8N8_9LACT|nr:DUF3272 family protein [Lactococcus insecticola]GFH40724.1 hypothetical protein Hs20B_11220 [Lactococcus insecticola]